MTLTCADSAYSFGDMWRLMLLMIGDEMHGPAATSTLDVLSVLYDRALRVTPQTADTPDRDRFLLSKRHGPVAYYAVLTAKGSSRRVAHGLWLFADEC
jgi:transketolase